MMPTPLIFPPDRFSQAEVFRGIFLYYIRASAPMKARGLRLSILPGCRHSRYRRRG